MIVEIVTSAGFRYIRNLPKYPSDYEWCTSIEDALDVPNEILDSVVEDVKLIYPREIMVYLKSDISVVLIKHIVDPYR